MLNYNLIKNLC